MPDHRMMRCFVPAVLLLLLTLSGCALPQNNDPTSDTNAVLGAMQDATNALTGSATGSPSNLPFSATGTSQPSDSVMTTDVMPLVQGLSSQQAATTGPTITQATCLGSSTSPGTVTLTTSGNYTDTTDSVTGVRTVTLSVNSDAQLQDCVGTSYTSTGNIHLSVSPDTVTITPDATYTNLQHWVLNRIESAYGTLDIQRHADGSMHHVTYSWNRNGTIAVTVDISGASLTLVSIDTLDQTVAVSANGQTCTGTLTGSLLQRYNWTCTAP